MTQSSRPARRPSDPYGLARRSGWIAPALAAVGLLIVAVVTLDLFFQPIPALPGTNSHGGHAPVARTPTPSNVVVANPGVSVKGSVAYVKAGNLWVQTGTATREITTSKNGSQVSSPAWSLDGRWIYYIDTRVSNGWWPPNSPSFFILTYPVLARIHPDGTGQQDVLSALIEGGTVGSKQLRYFYWIRQPSIAPDGSSAAVISDGPDPGKSDTVLQFVDLASGKLLPKPSVPETAPLGHTDPAYSPDGKLVAFVKEDRTGAIGEPSIWLYDVATGKAKALSSDGYRDPAWSPDGRYLAATRVSSTRSDVVILDAATGKQVAEVTSDGGSWNPVWSPAGDELAYFKESGEIVDLYLSRITIAAGTIEATGEGAVTVSGGLDGTSRAAWYGTGSNRGAAGSAPPS